MTVSANVPQSLAAVMAFEGRYAAGFVDPWHTHDRAQLSFALSGVLTVNTGSTSFVLPPNRAVWIPPHMKHQTICRSEVVFRVIYIDERFANGQKKHRVFEVSPLLRALIGEIAGFDRDLDMASREAAIVQLLLNEVDRMPDVPIQAELPRDRRLRRVCEAILADPADTREIDHWAKEVGMARRTFTRSFREETGMGLAMWRRQVRVMEAASRIAAGESVTTVAYNVGYNSPSAFTAMFHRTLGAAPTEYCRK